MELIPCIFRKALVSFVKDEQLMRTLEDGGYINHDRLEHALSEKASVSKLFHASLEIIRYCTERKDSVDGLKTTICREFLFAVKNNGFRIHLCDQGRNSRKVNRKSCKQQPPSDRKEDKA